MGYEVLGSSFGFCASPEARLKYNLMLVIAKIVSFIIGRRLPWACRRQRTVGSTVKSEIKVLSSK